MSQSHESSEDMIELKECAVGHAIVTPPARVAGTGVRGMGEEDIVKTTDIRVSVGDEGGEVEKVGRRVPRNITRVW